MRVTTKLRLPNGDLVPVSDIKDIRVAEKTVTVDYEGTYNGAKKSTFESELSQKAIDEIWNTAIKDTYGIIVSWEDYEVTDQDQSKD